MPNHLDCSICEEIALAFSYLHNIIWEIENDEHVISKWLDDVIKPKIESVKKTRRISFALSAEKIIKRYPNWNESEPRLEKLAQRINTLNEAETD